MKQYSLKDAQTRLSELIVEAQHGDTILIGDDEAGMVQLVPVSTKNKPRAAGSAAGMIKMAADFDAPIEDFDEYQL